MYLTTWAFLEIFFLDRNGLVLMEVFNSELGTPVLKEGFPKSLLNSNGFLTYQLKILNLYIHCWTSHSNLLFQSFSIIEELVFQYKGTSASMVTEHKIQSFVSILTST